MVPGLFISFDRDMTKAYFEKEKGRFVMNATIQMLHEMGLEMVSEGVETKEMLEHGKRTILYLLFLKKICYILF